jgi:hypothetical protein
MLLLAVALSLQDAQAERYEFIARAQLRCGAWGRARAPVPVTDEARREAARRIDGLQA